MWSRRFLQQRSVINRMCVIVNWLCFISDCIHSKMVGKICVRIFRDEWRGNSKDEEITSICEGESLKGRTVSLEHFIFFLSFEMIRFACHAVVSQLHVTRLWKKRNFIYFEFLFIFTMFFFALWQLNCEIFRVDNYFLSCYLRHLFISEEVKRRLCCLLSSLEL